MIIHQGNICYPFSMQEIIYDRFWLSPFYALRITTVFLTCPSELWPSSALGINCRLNFERHFAAVCGVVRSGKATFSLVRDRVLETLRLTASELKSDVSSHSTNPAYLTYIMDYIILYCICQEFFDFFGWRLISMGRNKGQKQKPLQACPSFLSLEERYRSQQSFLVVRTLICFQQASSLFPDFQTMSTNHNGWCKMSELNCSSCSQNKGATITLHPAYKRHYRSSHGIFFQI